MHTKLSQRRTHCSSIIQSSTRRRASRESEIVPRDTFPPPNFSGQRERDEKSEMPGRKKEGAKVAERTGRATPAHVRQRPARDLISRPRIALSQSPSLRAFVFQSVVPFFPAAARRLVFNKYVSDGAPRLSPAVGAILSPCVSPAYRPQ